MKKNAFVAGLVILLGCGALPVLAENPDTKPNKQQMSPAEKRQEVHKNVMAKIAAFKKADPGVERFFNDAAGYVVFPRVGKAAFIVGGGHGNGELLEKGYVMGATSLTLGSIGFQAGAQEFAQIIFFQDQAALARFKENKFEFSANASAVIVRTGASKEVDYRDGILVFTHATGGAMVEASLGAQKFKFEPDKTPKKL